MTAQPKPANKPLEYLSIAEAAALYHVSRDFIRRRISDGSLVAVRAGQRVIRIRTADLERLFREVQSAASMPPARSRWD